MNVSLQDAALSRRVRAVLATPLPYNQDAVGVGRGLRPRIPESAVETPPRLQWSSVKADFRPRVSLRFLREDAPWQQSAEIAQRCKGDTGVQMIILGLVILIVGFLLKVAILWTIGIVILVIGLILLLLGAIGHEVGGRRHYW